MSKLFKFIMAVLIIAATLVPATAQEIQPIQRGTLAARPAHPAFGRLYMVTNSGVERLTYFNGTSWVDITIDKAYITGGVPGGGYNALAGETYLTAAGSTITAHDINLTTNVTGILPIANGGTGSTTLNGIISCANLTDDAPSCSVDTTTAANITSALNKRFVTDAQLVVIGNTSGTNSGNVTFSGENYLSLTGQALTANAVNLSTSNVTGDLPFSNFVQASAISKLVGRGAGAGAGDFQEITLGTNLSMSGATLNATGGGSLPVTVVTCAGTSDDTAINAVVVDNISIVLDGVTCALDAPVTVAASNVTISQVNGTELVLNNAIDTPVVVLGDGVSDYTGIRLLGLLLDGNKANQTTAGAGIVVKNHVSEIVIDHAVIKDTFGNGIESSAVIPEDKSFVTFNTIKNSGDNCIEWAGDGDTVSNNTLFECGNDGIFADGNASPSVFAGNIIINPGHYGMTGNSGSLMFQGNTILLNNSAPARGIYARGLTDVIGNRIRTGNGSSAAVVGIYASGSSLRVINDNNIYLRVANAGNIGLGLYPNQASVTGNTISQEDYDIMIGNQIGIDMRNGADYILGVNAVYQWTTCIDARSTLDISISGGNLLYCSSYAINASNSFQLSVGGVAFESATNAVYSGPAASVTTGLSLKNNIIYGTEEDAFSLGSVRNSTISGNTFNNVGSPANTYADILLRTANGMNYSKNNVIGHNTMFGTDHKYGVREDTVNDGPNSIELNDVQGAGTAAISAQNAGSIVWTVTGDLTTPGDITFGSLAGVGTRCVNADANGLLGVAAADCASGGSPGGMDTEIQFNNMGAFDGFGSFDGTTVTLPYPVTLNGLYGDVAWGAGYTLPATIYAAGDRSIMFWNPRTGAFAAMERSGGMAFASSDVGDTSVLFGYNNIASGYASFVAGKTSTVAGDYSFSVGSGNDQSAGGKYQFTSGRDNELGSSDDIYALGNQNTVGDTAASNSSFAIGSVNTVNGRYSGIVGDQSIVDIGVTDEHGYVFGGNSEVYADGAMAIGLQAIGLAAKTITISTGPNFGPQLANNVIGNIAIGSNSTVPTLVITDSHGTGKVGTVCIGKQLAVDCTYGLTVATFGNTAAKTVFIQDTTASTGITTVDVKAGADQSGSSLLRFLDNGGSLLTAFNDLGKFVGDVIGNLTGNVTGNLTGNVTGNVTGALTGNADTVTVADAAADTTTWVLLGTSQTGSLSPASDAGITYNANTNALTATTFVGALTGNVTGDVTGNLAGNVTGNLTGAVTGNASTATALATARAINGVNFDGTGPITVTAAASTLTGTVLNAPVITSSLTTVGTIGTGVWQGTKVGLAYGGTNADLSATGGTSRVLKQITTGAAITVGQLACADLSDASATCATAGVPMARTVSTSSPLGGGGALSGDLTLTCATCGVTGTSLAQFASTSSAQMITLLSDETGSGLAVFGTAPVFASTMTIGTAAGTTGAINWKGTTSGTVTQTVAAAAGTWTFTLPITGGTNNYAMTTNGSGTATWSQISLTAGVTGTLPVANGGTNNATGILGIVPFGSSTGATVFACSNGGGTTSFLGTSGATSTTEANVQRQPFPASTATQMFVKQSGNTPASETATYTLRVNTANTTLTCAVGAGASTCSDTAHTGAITAGQLVDVQVVCAGGTTAVTGPVGITVVIQ